MLSFHVYRMKQTITNMTFAVKPLRGQCSLYCVSHSEEYTYRQEIVTRRPLYHFEAASQIQITSCSIGG